MTSRARRPVRQASSASAAQRMVSARTTSGSIPCRMPRMAAAIVAASGPVEPCNLVGLSRRPACQSDRASPVMAASAERMPRSCQALASTMAVAATEMAISSATTGPPDWSMASRSANGPSGAAAEGGRVTSVCIGSALACQETSLREVVRTRDEKAIVTLAVLVRAFEDAVHQNPPDAVTGDLRPDRRPSDSSCPRPAAVSSASRRVTMPSASKMTRS